MLTLCGFAASNYYNKVKLALLEKGVPFTEELAWVGETELACSPLGKVPYLKTEQGSLSESTVLLEYIEDAYPHPALLPAAISGCRAQQKLAVYTINLNKTVWQNG